MSVNFPKALIEEYKNELYTTYGVLVDDADAQLQLLTLTRSMFPTVTTGSEAQSREQGASEAL